MFSSRGRLRVCMFSHQGGLSFPFCVFFLYAHALCLSGSSHASLLCPYSKKPPRRGLWTYLSFYLFHGGVLTFLCLGLSRILFGICIDCYIQLMHLDSIVDNIYFDYSLNYGPLSTRKRECMLFNFGKPCVDRNIPSSYMYLTS